MGIFSGQKQHSRQSRSNKNNFLVVIIHNSPSTKQRSLVTKMATITNLKFLVAEHTVPIDVDKFNKETIEQDVLLWDSLEQSKWLPCDALEVA